MNKVMEANNILLEAEQVEHDLRCAITGLYVFHDEMGKELDALQRAGVTSWLGYLNQLHSAMYVSISALAQSNDVLKAAVDAAYEQKKGVESK